MILSLIRLLNVESVYLPKLGCPFAELKEAQVTVLWPLQVGDYGVIVIPSGVMVGQGEFPPLPKQLGTQ